MYGLQNRAEEHLPSSSFFNVPSAPGAGLGCPVDDLLGGSQLFGAMEKPLSGSLGVASN